MKCFIANIERLVVRAFHAFARSRLGAEMHEGARLLVFPPDQHTGDGRENVPESSQDQLSDKNSTRFAVARGAESWSSSDLPLIGIL